MLVIRERIISIEQTDANMKRVIAFVDSLSHSI